MLHRFRPLVSIVAGLLWASPAPAVWASTDLAKAKHCIACHAPSGKRIGPSFQQIAQRYRTDAAAAGRLALKVRQGGVGAWGQIPMPANPHVSEAEAQTLVRWILAQP